MSCRRRCIVNTCSQPNLCIAVPMCPDIQPPDKGPPQNCPPFSNHSEHSPHIGQRLQNNRLNCNSNLSMSGVVTEPGGLCRRDFPWETLFAGPTIGGTNVLPLCIANIQLFLSRSSLSSALRFSNYPGHSPSPIGQMLQNNTLNC